MNRSHEVLSKVATSAQSIKGFSNPFPKISGVRYSPLISFLSVSLIASFLPPPRLWGQVVSWKEKTEVPAAVRPLSGSPSLFAVAVPSQRRLVAVGENGTIMTSSDSGTTWIQTRLEDDAWLLDVAFFDGAVGWAVGSTGAVFVTEDGGHSWRDRRTENVEDLHAVWVGSRCRVWAAGANGCIIETSDCGKSWEYRRLAHDGVIRRLFFQGRTGCAVGDHGMILRTDDAGLTWQKLSPQEVGSRVNLYGIALFEGGAGFAWGDGGVLLKTTDGGQQWQPRDLKSPHAIRDVLRSPGGALVVLTSNGATYLDVHGPVRRSTQSDAGTRSQSEVPLAPLAFIEQIFPRLWLDHRDTNDATYLDAHEPVEGSTKSFAGMRSQSDALLTPLALLEQVFPPIWLDNRCGTDLVGRTLYRGRMLPDGQLLAVGSGGLIARCRGPCSAEEGCVAPTRSAWIDLSPIQTVGTPDPRGKRLVEVADQFVGARYRSNPLGEGPGGSIDRDPRLLSDGFDCVTFVEHALASELAGRFGSETLPLLDRIRYRGGEVSFFTRNHFFVVDWVPNNSWLVEDVTSTVGGPAAHLLRRTIRKSRFLRSYGLVHPEFKDQEHSTWIIPRQEIGNVADRLEHGMIVLMIGTRSWLFAIHTGILLRPADGSAVRLRHASGRVGKVVDEDFFAYLRRGGNRFAGIKLLRVVD